MHVDPAYQPGLQGIEGFSHLILVYWLHLAEAPELVFTPPFDDRPRGVFATRSPRRPNPIGLSVVAFDGLEAPGILRPSRRSWTLSAIHRPRCARRLPFAWDISPWIRR